ncbi:hypothetical protein [Planococcus shixiaomingii]|uniref:hypothetical protein n=1 Tax=Planococcus shixiaomingii TaxID=3058393 RepID=UPI00260F0817|nr:hypothetical protein [Planococcus sp. N022]WKA56629.1 hypothetical protein QWY21_09865 [Planococcus sp. N022]
MKNNRSILQVLFLILFALLLTGCSSSKSWVSDFVVWDGYYYDISDEYVVGVGEEIGEVTKYSDVEGTYSGNFSNHYKVGTKYFAISGIEPDEAIAIEEDGRYRKAVRGGKYIEE